MRYGLIGESLPHTFSPEIHRLLGNPDYEVKELTREELPVFMQKKEFLGINVTIPYKEMVIPYLDEMDGPSKAIGAVNTIVNRDGKLYGYNTDYIGFARLLKENGITLAGKKVLILGTGGTSKTVRAVCKDQGAAKVKRASRSASGNADDVISYEEAVTTYADAEVILNTTPCGMFPKVTQSPIDLTAFPQALAVADVIYNPLTTELVLDARALGRKAVNGLPMLVYQAEAAEEIWGVDLSGGMSGKKVSEKLACDKRNLVLIGMPGSGKTTAGNLLKETMGRTLVDTDVLIVEKEGRSIPEIFAAEGETYFRDVETKITEELMTQTGLIISTGGGTILREENVRNLKRNGMLIYLNPELSLLTSTEGRPLLKSVEDIKNLYEKRHEKYEAAADQIVTITEYNDTIVKEIEDAFFGNERA